MYDTIMETLPYPTGITYYWFGKTWTGLVRTCMGLSPADSVVAAGLVKNLMISDANEMGYYKDV